MTEHAQPQGRKRSSSLQRMLELEKKLQHERQGTSPHANSLSSASATSDSAPNTPPTQQRRFELAPRKENRKAAPIPTRNYDAVPPPLVINTATKPDAAAPMHRKELVSESRLPNASISVVTPEKPTPKTVAFMFPPEVEEQRAVCQSPSWEAYGRRKKEKKEEKRGRKEKKEELMKDTRPRGRRLSKARPEAASQAPSLGDRTTSDSVIPVRQIKPKPRPSSVLGIPIPRKEEEPEKPKRGRSGSLTRVLRSSFEIRRSSFDRDSGFIGGVKLEQEKKEFHQKVLEDQAKGDNKVHPALRKSFIGHGTFTPLKTEVPSRSEKPEKPEKESRRRACPPISIQAAAARNPGLLTPTSPQKPDFANIYLWSARANQGLHADDDCAVYDSEDQTDRLERQFPPNEEPQPKGTGLHRSGGIYVRSSPPPSYPSDFNPYLQEDITPKTELEVREPPKGAPVQKAEPKPVHETKPTESRTHIAYAQKSPKKSGKPRGGSFSSILSVPPEPPRKSSKRNSLVFLGRNQSSTSGEESTSPSDILETKLTLKGKNEKMILSSPPSIPYERTSAGARPKMYGSDPWSPSGTKWNIKDAARAAFRRGSISQSSLASPATSVNPAKDGSYPASPKKDDKQLPTPPEVKLPTRQPTVMKHHTSMLDDRHGVSLIQSPSSWRPDTSSSEDESYSDALRSSSPPSTPDTSPPMSETGHPPSVANLKKPFVNGHKYNHSWSGTNTPESLMSERFPERFPPSWTGKRPVDSPVSSEFDPIEVAARKVMEAFPDARMDLPSFQRSQTDLTKPSDSRISLQPCEPLQPKKSRSRNLSESPNRSLEEARSAEYLQAARKIAPVPPLPHPRSYDQSSLTPQSPTSPLSPQSPRSFTSRGHRATMSNPETLTKLPRHQQKLDRATDDSEPIAKMFVECCSCKYYHDMPSKLYEAMANPEAMLTSTESLGFVGKVSMTVRCPWCKHEMSTKCCAGLAAMVYIKERLH